MKNEADPPVVCSLQPGDLNARAAQLLPGLAALATNRIAIDGGYRFEFETTTAVLQAIANVVDAERQCCRFLRFQLTVEPNGGPSRLDVTGPDDTAAFLRALVELA